MNLTKTEALILRKFGAGSELYGLQIVAESEGALNIGSIYVMLKRLQDKNLLSSEREVLPVDSQRPPRRLYKLTALGLRLLRAYEILESP
jgi:DNA-binding PadR family transcriptional regulator